MRREAWLPAAAAVPEFKGEYGVVPPPPPPPGGFPRRGVGPAAVGVVPLGTLLSQCFTSFFSLLESCLSTSASLRRIRLTNLPSLVT